ncbi:MAG: hypothetical protein AAFX85_07845 [Pseudomonadota bacterium]
MKRFLIVPTLVVLMLSAGVAGAGRVPLTMRTAALFDILHPYGNTIPDRSFPVPYTEICLRGEAFEFDVHEAGEGTHGGNCSPGSMGWVIARTESTARSWHDAVDACRAHGMRLPAVLEWQLSCQNAENYRLLDITHEPEWAANVSSLSEAAGRRQRRRGRADQEITMGEAWCTATRWNYVMTVGASDSDMGKRSFRCAQ